MDVLAHCRRLLAHPIAGYLALVVLLAAVVQGAGRLGMRLVDGLGGVVNAYLGEQASLVGLRGGWHGLNPLLRLERVETPSGWAEQLLVEFDWLETLLRSRVVLRRLFVERAELEVAYVDGRWALAGMGEGPLNFDWAGLLNDTDELRFRGLLRVAGTADSGLQVEALGINRDGLHGLDLTLSRNASPAPGTAIDPAAVGGPEAGCGERCSLSLRWRELPNRWSSQPSRRNLEMNGTLAVPAAYLPWLDLAAGMEVDANGRWAQRDDAGGGEFRLQIRQGASTDAKTRFAARIEAVSSGAMHAAVIADARLDKGDLGLELSPIIAKSDARRVDLWTQELHLDPLNPLLIAALGESAASGWLAGANPKGHLRNVHVRLSAEGMAYAATLDGVATSAHRGVPMLAGIDGALLGYERGLVLALNAEAVQAHFADTFTDSWRLDNVQGQIDSWFGDGYLGARSTHFRAELPDGPVAGTFALARPPERFDQRLSLRLSLDRLRVPDARIYVPFTLPAGLQQWLYEAPRTGELADFRLAYQGQVHTQPQDYSRRAALSARVIDGEVRFHQDWPRIANANGELAVSGEDVFAQIEAAASLGVAIQASAVHVGRNGAFADIDLQVEADAGAALAYIRASPLAEWLAFVEPEWTGQGRLGIGGRVFAPLNEPPAEPQGQEALAADLDFALDGLTLAMPNYRLRVSALEGAASYQFPYDLNSAPMTADLFGHPATLTASAGENSINFHIVGQAEPEDVYQLAAMEDPGLARGTFPFDATLAIPVDGQAPRLTTRTGLEGLRILLPGEFGKAAEVARPTQADLEFLDEHVAIDFSHGVVQGWLHVDEAPLRGALGVRGPPPPVPPSGDEILISGTTAAVDVQEWTQGAGDWEFPAPWRLQDVDVRRVTIETTDFQDVRVQGSFRDGLMALAFDSEHLQGRLRDPGDAPLDLHFDAIVLPESEDEEDPLDAAVIDRLPAADVTIDSILIGEEDFGRWSFAMRPSAEGLALNDLEGELKGTVISAPDGVFWNRQADSSAAAALLTMEDLHEVLPQWGYAPSLHSDSAELRVDGRWPGSPLNVSLENFIGAASFRAEAGRFVEVESGAGARRIFSLLNFNTIAKRMNFNFKDVMGKGISFDRIKAETRLDSGTLTFLEPAKIKGSGSDFKIGGSIDLVAGVMNNNEMIVTLPVDDSLPWYAVYISLANPVTGLAVLAGQQMLKKQIKQFSSAKYEVSGPWDDPKVKLVGIWNDNMQTFNELPDEPAQAQGGR